VVGVTGRKWKRLLSGSRQINEECALRAPLRYVVELGLTSRDGSCWCSGSNDSLHKRGCQQALVGDDCRETFFAKEIARLRLQLVRMATDWLKLKRGCWAIENRCITHWIFRWMKIAARCARPMRHWGGGCFEA
jgi:hypothetical protein